MSGYSTSYAEETIGLRGYDNGAISSTAYVMGGEWTGSRYSAYDAYAYDRFTLELRYPFMLGNTTIYGLGFLEGGNAWAKTRDFNPVIQNKTKYSAKIPQMCRKGYPFQAHFVYFSLFQDIVPPAKAAIL